MIFYFKVKGVAPQMVSDIHAEVERLGLRDVNASMEAHPVVVQLMNDSSEDYARRVQAVFEDLRREISEYNEEVLSDSSVDPDAEKECQKRLEEFERLSFVVGQEVKINPAGHGARILKSSLRDDDKYEIEIEITLWNLELRTWITLSQSRETSWLYRSCPSYKILDEFKRVSETRRSLSGGSWLYGRLMGLLGFEQLDVQKPKS